MDPDNGINSQRKLATTRGLSSTSIRLMQSVPTPDDIQWTCRLYNLPGITFGTIYDHLVDCKVVLKKVSYLENIADRRAEAVLQHISGDHESSNSISIDYTRTLDKAYRFFQDGHVQKIKYHPLPQVLDHSCVSAAVLPSMKKDRVYKVIIFLHDSTARVAQACCSCPAGLSGCCNHITGTLYCLEDYIHSGLQDDERKGCTERLQTWNQPRKINTEPKPTDDVQLVRKEYGVVKRPKTHRINEWDCRPEQRRIIDPNKARNLRKALLNVEQLKIASASYALSAAETPAQKKKAAQTKSLLERYGSTCFSQLLDDEPAPVDSHIDEIRKERVVRAAEQKKKLLNELAAKLDQVKHDHTYASFNPQMEDDTIPANDTPAGLSHVMQLYNSEVVLDAKQIEELEEKTRGQSTSDLWHSQRKLRITASIMREVCHRRASTSCSAFIRKKIDPVPLNTIAVRYGREHEKDAIDSYVEYQVKRGVAIVVQKCGLVVDASLPWLAASPDAIVSDPSLKESSQGCLEVKCPFLCEKMSISEACKTVAAFCLIVGKDGDICLSKCHSYYYQVQTQMHVTCLLWCDFVVWSPLHEPFVERIKYDAKFMKQVISTAEKFYFNQFLPAVVPHVIMPPPNRSSPSSSVPAVVSSHTQMSIKLPSKHMPTIPSHRNKKTASDDVQIIATDKTNLLSADYVLKHLHVAKHVVKGDGSCLYHAVSHQAGFLSSDSQGDDKISSHLRNLALRMMWEHPDVRTEVGMSPLQWFTKRGDILCHDSWGGDLDIRLLAIGLQREIVVLTTLRDGSTYARRYYSQPPPMPKMKGGVFVPLTTEDLCRQWKLMKPAPLLIIYNGHNHYDSTKSII